MLVAGTKVAMNFPSVISASPVRQRKRMRLLFRRVRIYYMRWAAQYRPL